eukprot:jgi/Bigna1/135819/aug1.31_g10527
MDPKILGCEGAQADDAATISRNRAQKRDPQIYSSRRSRLVDNYSRRRKLSSRPSLGSAYDRKTDGDTKVHSGFAFRDPSAQKASSSSEAKSKKVYVRCKDAVLSVEIISKGERTSVIKIKDNPAARRQQCAGELLEIENVCLLSEDTASSVVGSTLQNLDNNAKQESSSETLEDTMKTTTAASGRSRNKSKKAVQVPARIRTYAPVIAERTRAQSSYFLRRQIVDTGRRVGGSSESCESATLIQWNEHFQSALENVDFEHLSQLSVDFVSMAQSYIKIIVMEQFLPEDKQTIRPASHVGGIAGGRKYLAGGILFKMIYDPPLHHKKRRIYKNDRGGGSKAKGEKGGEDAHQQGVIYRYLYGNERANYELAAKSASHNLHGASHYFQIGYEQIRNQRRNSATTSAPSAKHNNYFHTYMSGGGRAAARRRAREWPALRVPMQVALDYLGYRVLAQPWLRLERPIYGGNGSTIHVPPDSHPVAELMEKAATKLHLAKHKVMGKADLHCAGDVEAHLGQDGRVYLLDLARTFPPEDAQVTEHLPIVGQPVFYRMVRPELLQILKREGDSPPLSPDAFTGFSRGDPDAEHHEKKATKATEYLLDHVIPDYARQLSALSLEDASRFREPVSSELHARGINVRHLGLLHGLVQPKAARVRDTLLVEMTARTLKNILRGWLREQLREDRYPSEFRMNRVVVGMLNFLVGPSAVATTTTAAAAAAAAAATTGGKGAQGSDEKGDQSSTFFSSSSSSSSSSSCFKRFWNLALIEKRARFGSSKEEGLALASLKSSPKLWKVIRALRGRVLNYLCKMTGIKLAPKSLREFQHYLEADARPGHTRVSFRFYTMDLEEIDVLSKPLSILQLSRSRRYLELGIKYLLTTRRSSLSSSSPSSANKAISKRPSYATVASSSSPFPSVADRAHETQAMAAGARLLALAADMYQRLLKSYPKHEQGQRGERLACALHVSCFFVQMYAS